MRQLTAPSGECVQSLVSPLILTGDRTIIEVHAAFSRQHKDRVPAISESNWIRMAGNNRDGVFISIVCIQSVPSFVNDAGWF